MNHPTVSEHKKIQKTYETLRKSGLSHNLADMFAHSRPPMSRTDREFLEGQCNGNQFERTPYVGERYKAVADRAGVSITGKVYKSALARFPGDPEAWVSGRGDVQRVVEQRGWECEGSVKVNAHRPGPSQEVAVADDILEGYVDPAIKGEAREEAKHEVKQKIKPHWSKD